MEPYRKPSGDAKMCVLETANGSYEVVARACVNEAYICQSEEAKVWHQRLDHVSSEVIQTSIPHVRGINRHGLTNKKNYGICKVGKSTRVPRKTAKNDGHEAEKALERVFSDVVGLIKHMSIGTSRYFDSVLDSYSGYSMVRFIGRKNEAVDAAIGMYKQ